MSSGAYRDMNRSPRLFRILTSRKERAMPPEFLPLSCGGWAIAVGVNCTNSISRKRAPASSAAP